MTLTTVIQKLRFGFVLKKQNFHLYITSLDNALDKLMSVMVLSLAVEWGVGMERQGPSYGEVVNTRDVRVQALLGGSKSPTSRSLEAVEWIICI